MERSIPNNSSFAESLLQALLLLNPPHFPHAAHKVTSLSLALDPSRQIRFYPTQTTAPQARNTRYNLIWQTHRL